MVRICDAVMGSGKSSAAIEYINAHPEKKFLYITPYLPEAKRIKDGCPAAQFVEPQGSDDNKYIKSKSMHSIELIKKGRNIASTHQAMKYYTLETFQDLKEKGYSVIIDEEIEVLQRAPKISFSDIKIAKDCGYIYESRPREYERTDVKYEGGKFSSMFRLMESRPLVLVNDEDSQNSKRLTPWYWIFSTMLFEYVDDIIVLTYMFKNSEMDHFLQMNHVEYKYIGIHRTEDGRYQFTDHRDFVPEYTKTLPNMIHISEHEKMNDIGENRCSLSINWYRNNPEDVDQIRKNLINYFKHIEKRPAKYRMCGTYKEFWDKIKDKGFTKSDVIFTKKSTNEFSDRCVLAYPVNIFANGSVVSFYSQKGFAFDNDRYALSIMVQWIWRSAIRNGKEIWIYVPSKRMRNLLEGWVEEVSKG